MKFVIGNWKMKLSGKASVSLAEEVERLIGAWIGETEVIAVVCPSHLALGEVARVVSGSPIALGAQDVFWEDEGAFTGEASPRDLEEIGCAYCIVGHSERREFLGETDAMVNRKTAALLRHGITPIICVGETRDERLAGRRDSVVVGQVKAALSGIRPADGQRVIIAYEPRWVIGTGEAVAPEDAAEMHHLIREAVGETLGDGARQPAAGKDAGGGRCFVIYGGSVDSRNLRGFLEVPVIDGVLVGGASLKAAEFLALSSAAAGREE
jgi:triosephosphate isomerase